MNKELLNPNLKDLTNEELVKYIQTTNETCYWEELDNRTKRVYNFILRKYVHSYYKETMLEDVTSLLKQGWVKAVLKYDENKATADFVPFCSKLMHQTYVQFARRMNEKKVGTSVRDCVLSSVIIDNDNVSDKMTQGCIDNIMEYEVKEYEDIETKDFINSLLAKLKNHNELQYIIIKKHCIDGVTQRELGDELQMSQSAISRHIKKGLDFLKKRIQAEMI